MDEVELVIPTVCSVSKLMGPEGFSSGGAASEGGGEIRQSITGSILIKSSVKACSSSLISKKEPSYREKDSLRGINYGNAKPSIQLITGLEANQLHRKSSKIARSSNVSSKKPRISQMEISLPESVAEDPEGSYSESVSGHTPKLKNNSSFKQREKRNNKPSKIRGDSFCLKNGLISFTSSSGVNNFLGVSTSKSDLYDVTKHADELSLNELLDGTYKCPVYSKDEGKKVINSNDSLILSVKKAWSILRLQKCVGPTNNREVENASSANKDDCDKEDVDMSLTDKVQEQGENLKKTVIHSPIEVLNLLTLSQNKDLDSLLVEATKPVLSTRDRALGKPVSIKTGLPPFPWSHSSSAHSKLSPDAKLPTAKNTCQGRWVKMESNLSRSKDFIGLSVDIESVTVSESLVPSVGPEIESLEIVKPSSGHGQPVITDEPTPRVLAAAKILHDLKKITKTKTKSEDPKSRIIDDVMVPSKKLKFSVDVKFTDISTKSSGPGGLSGPSGGSGSGTRGKMEGRNSNVVNKTCMMPPPPRMSREKERKVVSSMDLNMNRSGSHNSSSKS